jgi:hypothetical protein
MLSFLRSVSYLGPLNYEIYFLVTYTMKGLRSMLRYCRHLVQPLDHQGSIGTMS